MEVLDRFDEVTKKLVLEYVTQYTLDYVPISMCAWLLGIDCLFIVFFLLDCREDETLV